MKNFLVVDIMPTVGEKVVNFKCPHCGEKSWNKKVVSKGEQND